MFGNMRQQRRYSKERMPIVAALLAPRFVRALVSLLLVATAALSVSGCAARLTPQQIAAADYGSYPANYQEIVKAWFADRLKDPYSAVYEFSAPFQGYSTKPPIMGGGADQFGYWVTAQVNAKNSFGGYTGAKTYKFLIHNGTIVAHIDPRTY